MASATKRRGLGPPQRARAWKTRVRSYSANIVVGPGNIDAGLLGSTFAHVTNLSGFIKPGPVDSWVFIEEHPDSINDLAFLPPDPAFFPPYSIGGWLDVPASHHNRAANLTFGDGHVEPHLWESSYTVANVTFSFPTQARSRANPDPDWLRALTPTK